MLGLFLIVAGAGLLTVGLFGVVFVAMEHLDAHTGIVDALAEGVKTDGEDRS